MWCRVATGWAKVVGSGGCHDASSRSRGGRGTRLSPLTDLTLKSLMPVNGRLLGCRLEPFTRGDKEGQECSWSRHRSG